jgi:hypothetical protein
MRTVHSCCAIITLLTGVCINQLGGQTVADVSSALERAALADSIRYYDARWTNSSLSVTNATVTAQLEVIKSSADGVVVFAFLRQPFEVVKAPTKTQLETVFYRMKSLSGMTSFGGNTPPPAPGAQPVGFSSLLGGADLIGGLTQFMVERAKDEVAFSFMLTLKRDANQVFVRVGFPRSWALVTRIDSETFQSLMPPLRAALLEDLNNLPVRLASEDMRDSMEWGTTPAYLRGLAVAYTRGLQIRRGVPPAVALATLTEVTNSEVQDPQAQMLFHLVGLIAREYATLGGAPFIQRLRASSEVQRYFAAFVGHDAVGLNAHTATARAALCQIAGRYQVVTLLANQLHSTGLRADSLMRTSGAAEPGARDYMEATGAVIQLLSTARGLLPANTEAGGFERYIQDALALHQAFARRDYGMIVGWIGTLPEVKVDAKVLRYVSFAASLASASNSEEVATALRTASAPVGSYRTKRNQVGGWGPGTISLVGYLGLSGGAEGIGSIPSSKDAAFAGVALPVGFEVSLGHPWGAVSAFASILDLGNLASVRLGGPDSIEAAPELGWEQVFAPGLFVVFNATRNIPLSVGVGLQAVQNLRESNTDTGSSRVDVVRFGAFIGVDATLFQFRF